MVSGGFGDSNNVDEETLRKMAMNALEVERK
jgi:hypothetical protein